MSTPLLTTKLYIPPPRPRERVVLRARLIERPDEGLRLGRKLTLISAPPYFLLPTPLFAWLSLDESDNDLPRFLAYLVAALQTIESHVGQGLLAALKARTEGWIAGPQLAALSIGGCQQKGEDTAEFIAAFAGDDRYIADYLVDEVLARQPEDVRDCMLQTSVLDVQTWHVKRCLPKIGERAASQRGRWGGPIVCRATGTSYASRIQTNISPGSRLAQA